MECKKFVVQSNIDFIRPDAVRYLEMTATQFDDLDGASTINSRLRVVVTWGESAGFGAAGGDLAACYNNCNYLARFVKEVIWPRLL
jgi:hypothetical protein